MYKSIFLIGFRSTGKTTVGQALATKLGWTFLDTDDLVKQKTGSNIAMFTKKGTAWQEFRQLEHNVIMELMHKHEIVVGVGGGAPVNDVIQPQSGKTFGALNAELFKNNPDALLVLLTAPDDIIFERMKNTEMEKDEIVRPILDETKASEVEEMLKQYDNDPQKKKEIMVEEIIKDSRETLKIRKPLYPLLTDKIIDTCDNNIDTCVEEILKYAQAAP